MKLELIPIPVSDLDKSKDFYASIGFNVDHDVQPNAELRFIQLTPPSSSCSIVLGVGMYDADMNGKLRGLHLVVDNIEAAREFVSSKGVDVSDVNDMGGIKYAYFSDPDGNSWAMQQL